MVTLLIVGGAVFAQIFVQLAGEMRSDNLRMRNEASIHIRQLRNAFLDVEKNLDAFLWLPSEEGRDRVHHALEAAIEEQHHLYTLEWFTTSNMKAEMDDFGRDLSGLHLTLDNLMESRIDPARQDPYLALHAEFFQPATRRFTKAVTAALQHLENPDNARLRNTLHQPLEDLRTEWMRVDILTEGFSGLTTSGQNKASSEFEELQRYRQSLLTSLSAMENRLLPLPAGAPLRRDWNQISLSANQWNEGFDRLRALVGEGHARGDIHFLVTRVEPQMAHIWEYVQKLDEKLEEMANHDVTQLAEAAATIAHALWLLAFIGLALLVTGLIYFERSVLSPIVMVARALRAEARGHAPMPLPQAQSLETHHLIDAFNQMRHQVQQRQQSLEFLALHDTLTGLANREQLVRTMSDSETPPLDRALLVIGLNRFKEINNSLGHTVGDQLLIAIARRLLDAAIRCTTIARLGGDEFALLLSGNESKASDSVARQIIRELESPFEVADQSLYISASIGIALAPEHGNDPLALLQKADVAMHVAKQHNSGLVHYNADHDRHAVRRLGLANDLRSALKESRCELTLAYQPQVDLINGRFCGMEALLRWTHPVEGPVCADEVIPIAENTGLIFHLTPWVLERAFEEVSALEQFKESVRLAINLSVFNLHDHEFLHKLDHLMHKWSIAPANLQLEITESAMMDDPKRAHRTLHHIHAMGIELAIDDFGTGFSSLSYLKHLPVSKLKIDKSFVMSMLQNDNDAVIIRSTIDMAHNLGLQVVAEGVENQETFDLLAILNCDIAQGFLVSRPLEIAPLQEWLNNQPRLTSPIPLWASK